LEPLAPPFERVIAELQKLPGVGRKTAQRLAYHLLRVSPSEVASLAEAIGSLREKIRECSVCFNLADGELCPICADAGRDRALLCIVEEPANIASLERASAFRGVYHVLGGVLSPLKDVGPDNLRVRELLERVRKDGFREIVLATSPTVEGESTAVYLARLLKPLGVATTRLAVGLPAGADLEFTDDLTLRRALEARREY
jgi:recombination protein RecR